MAHGDWTMAELASSMVEKWGVEVSERGFAQIPNYLLMLNQFLESDARLSAGEMQVLIQLVGAWWRKGDMPFPSMRTLAVRCGISDRQVQRAIARLEELGLIKRIKRRTKGIIASNAYDLAPLVEILRNVAEAYPNEFPRRVERTQAKERILKAMRKPAPLKIS